ncbi:integrase [Streptomyces sp. ICN441]|uniref:tyrosine-type recombinase/integrase n=1 Tax=Streptomyces sp. ICN441 TaxID=2558286 RepID=UPI001068F1A3|nr:tyrosine-type recombinase/integrase [Streptomyces sp. ICN441]TFE54711.1 integrase [Streptomyces sp. ICN441]
MDTPPATADTEPKALVPVSRTGGLSPEARAAVDEGIPAETRRGYAGDWHRFTTWCESTGRRALPASADTVTEYMTHLKKEDKSPGTMDRALASIAVAHQAAEQRKPATVGARRVLKGHEAERKRSKDPRRRTRRAAAATPPVLRKMVAAVDTTRASGRRDVAALLLGFAIAARRSELRLLDWADVTDVEEGLAVEVWRPKVNHEGPLGVPYGSNPATCPVRSLRAWRQCLVDRGRQPAGPLFLRIDRHDRIAHPMHRHGRPIGDPTGRITGEGIGDLITRAAVRAHLTAPIDLLPDLPPRWSGHSLRRGFATAAKQAGADLIETGRHGGWADGSASLAAYFEEAGIWDATNPLYGIGL